MAKIENLFITEQQAAELLGISPDLLATPPKYPNYGVPLPQQIVSELFNILIAEGYIADSDYNCFSYYFNCDNKVPPHLKQIKWTNNLDALRLLLYSVFEPYLKNGCLTKKRINEVTIKVFIKVTKDKQIKEAKLYPQSAELTTEALVLRDFILPTCAKITSLLLGNYKPKHVDKFR